MKTNVPDFDNPKVEGKLYPMGKPERKKSDTKGAHKFWFNPCQSFISNWRANRTYAICGRGTGKTTMMSVHLAGVWSSIPRGSSAFMGASIRQLYVRTFPAVVKSLEMLTGLKEGVDFFRGQPPASVRKSWPTPLTKPRSWENVVMFRTGHATYLSSMSVMGSINGMSIQALLGDELKLCPSWPRLVSETLPAVRSELYDNPLWDTTRNPYMLSHFFVSDAGLSHKERAWEFDVEKWAAQPEILKVNEQIAGMLAELKHNPRKMNDSDWVERLNRLRCKSSICVRFPSTMNADLLGRDWFRDKELTLPANVFRVSIMGVAATAVKDGYYSALNEDIHLYLPDPKAQTELIYSKMQSKTKMKQSDGVWLEWEAPDFDAIGEHAYDSYLDVDLDPKLPLRIAFDYGANFNCMCIGQVHSYKNGRRELRIVKAMYVQNERKLPELVMDFCNYYEPHRCSCKDIIYYMDSTARQGASYTSNSDEFRSFNIVMSGLRRRGWNVTMIDMKRPMLHEVKYNYMNQLLGGFTKMDVRINSENCNYLVGSLQNAQVVMGTKGPRKDKHLEKYQNETPLEEGGLAGTKTERSDFSDSFDTLCIGCGKYTDAGVPITTLNEGVIFCMPTMLT